MPKKVIGTPIKVKSISTQATELIPDGIRMANAPAQWEKGNTGKDVVVAVIDTGVDYNHPDLVGNIIGGKDFTGGNDYMDRNGHGTHVAGTIAATNSGTGIVGMAPDVKILALKALDDDGTGYMEWTIQAIRYAIEQGVDVINMSLGGPHVEDMHNAVKEAAAKGIIIVAAAGNEGDGNEDTLEISYPGVYPEVIEVGAIDKDGNLAYFSNTNDEIDVHAHGVEVVSCYPGGRYARLDGTSMATPHVAGAAALLKVKEAFLYHKGDLVLDVTPEVEPEPEPEPVLELPEPEPTLELPEPAPEPAPEPEPEKPVLKEPKESPIYVPDRKILLPGSCLYRLFKRLFKL